MKTQLFDLHECHSTRDLVTGKVIQRWSATPKYNLPYAVLRRVKQTLETDRRYPRGTFFVITPNGELPEFIRTKTSKTLL